MSVDPWLVLTQRITGAERNHRRAAERLWQDNDLIAAGREKALADGLSLARDLQLDVSEDRQGGQPEPSSIDGAMHSVWLHGKWRWLTSKMTTEQREAAADAVQRHSDWLKGQDDEPGSELPDLRWWRS